MNGILALALFSLVMLAMVAGAELSRSLVARLARFSGWVDIFLGRGDLDPGGPCPHQQ